MMDLMVYDKTKELYGSLLIIRKSHHCTDYICKAGDIDVTVTADQRDHRQVTAGD